MIQLDDICLSFGDQIIFDHISASIAPSQKIGLVGRNGSGKTTLLKTIVGMQHLDEGCVRMPKAFRVAFMPQEVVLTSQRSIVNETVSAIPALAHALDELAALETIADRDEAMNARYVAAHHYLHEHDYDNVAARAQSLLAGLGFSQARMHESVSSLSVGWKMRVVLAKLLLQEADFYLFDEPTNHLDLVAKDWFVEFLKSAPWGFILVAHDEYFLNTSCHTIAEISQGKLTFYTGSYDNYLVQKEANKTILEKHYEQQQRFIKKQTETIERFRYKATKAKMVQSMIKSLEKMDRIELEQDEKSVSYSLGAAERAGKIVLQARNLSFSFGERMIFDHVNLEIMRGHRVAIVAPNGTGKTTLLNVLMGKLVPTTGNFSLGYNVHAAYFEQDQCQSLNPKLSVLEEAESAAPNADARARVRGLLGAFLFSGDDVFKKIAVLSGGEKNRVAMVKVLLQEANFLLLDEPTNHLDIVSKRALLEVLLTFEGTILFVSHDRTFLNLLATDILELTPHGAYIYPGTYDEYLYQKKMQQAVVPNAQPAKMVVQEKVPREHKKQSVRQDVTKQLAKLEGQIERIERELVVYAEKLGGCTYGTKDYAAALEKLTAAQHEHGRLLHAWEELMAHG